MISILGCGWLGMPLAKKLIEKGKKVKGSTTNPQNILGFKNVNIEPFLIQLPDNKNDQTIKDFLKSEVLIVAIPPKARLYGEQYHIEQIKKILSFEETLNLKEIIYISSTSVYIEENKEVNELSNIIEKSTLVQTENILIDFCQSNNIQYSILRCGGLMGFDRFPAKYISNRNLINGSNPVNYIHLTDLIEIIYLLMNNSNSSEIYNICAPLHPTREEVFLKNCKDANLEKPIFEKSNEKVKFKIIDSRKVIEKIKFKFEYSDPLHFYYNFVDQNI